MAKDVAVIRVQKGSAVEWVHPLKRRAPAAGETHTELSEDEAFALPFPHKIHALRAAGKLTVLAADGTVIEKPQE